MIRSLVADPKTPITDLIVRRNLERDQLEQVIKDGYLLWIDVVDAEGEEITWLAEQFNLSPAVVDDLKRDDRRPTLLVYPDYLFLSLFEPKIAIDQVRKPIFRIKQQLIKLRQMIAPQREVFSNVIGEPRLTQNGNTRDLFRHLYERLLRVYDIIDSQRDLSSNVLDMIQNQESRRLVEAVNRLMIFFATHVLYQSVRTQLCHHTEPIRFTN